MRRRGADFWSSFCLLLLSGAVIYEAFNLELGTPRNPGSGFMVFGAAAALSLFALRQFVASLLLEVQGKESAAGPIHWGRIVCVILAVLAYILLLEPVGYLLSTFLLLTLLFQVLETGQWMLRTLGAALASVLSYSIFAKAMQVNLPKGLLAFF